MGTKKNAMGYPRLAWANPNFSSEQTKPRKSRGSVRASRSRRTSKIPSKRLNRLDAGVFPFLASNLLDASLREPGIPGDPGPLALTFLQLLDDVGMDGLRHSGDIKPAFGLMQPENGRDINLRSLIMVVGRPQKIATPKDIIGQILIDNVEARWRRAFPMAANDKERLEALARRSGVGKETLRKMMKGEQSPRIDTVDKVARALGTTCDILLKVARAEDQAA